MALVGTAELCKLAKAAPAVKKTGNALEDSKAESERGQFQLMIHTCVTAPNVICPLYGEMSNLLKVKETHNESGLKLMVAATLKSVDTVVLSTWLVTASDLTAEDIGELEEADAENLLTLTCLATQLPPSIRLDCFAEFGGLTEEVFLHILDDLHNSNNNRLKDFKKSTRYRTGMPDLAVKGCYKINWKKPSGEDRASITHIPSGDEEEIAKQVVILPNAVLNKNHLDMNAEIVHPPMPPVPLANFFKAKWGTDTLANSQPYYVAKSKQWAKYVQDQITAVEKKKKASSSSDVGKGVKRVLGQVSKKKKQDHMSKARVTAKAALARKKAKKEIKLAETPSAKARAK